MKKRKLIIALIICSVLLVAELAFLGVMYFRDRGDSLLSEHPTDPAVTTAATSATEPSRDTEPAQTDPYLEKDPTEGTGDVTEPSDHATEPTETEPKEQRYILTFVGDCTLASAQGKHNADGSFVKTVGEDYGYPFRNVVQFFNNDDFTMVNLESVLADEGRAAGGKTFTFKGPTAYTQILTGSSVEAVTLANNHTEDYGKDGYASTTAALEDAGVAFVEKDGTLLFTTDSGLTIGIYAATFKIDKKDMQADIAELRTQGAEIIVCAFHWGNEGQYRPTKEQQTNAYDAIDAGADIVYGSHPHVLQKIEEYNGGIIYYSLGNFSFGGNHFPRDMDSVIVRQEVIRREDGTVELGELRLIPVSISSMTSQNNFQPTPYEEGTKEYERTLSKLDGTFKGPDLIVDYSFLDPSESTEPSDSTDPTGSTDATQPGDDAGTDQPTQGSGEAGNDTGNNAGDTGNNGGDTANPPADSGNDGSGADSGADTGSSGAGEAPAEG